MWIAGYVRWSMDQDHCYSAYSVAEDGTEEYATPSLLASQQYFTPNFDATRLGLDSPYQPKGVYRQRRKFLGSFLFWDHSCDINAPMMSYYRGHLKHQTSQPTCCHLHCVEKERKKDTTPPRQGMTNSKRWCVHLS